MITFATFHADFPPHTLQAIRDVSCTFQYFDHETFIKCMFTSAERFHPGCRKVVLTDEKTPFSLPSYIEIIREPLFVEQFQTALIQSRISFIRKNAGTSHMVLLDSDILFQANLESVFDRSFDIAFTLREKTPIFYDTPINLGIVFVHRNGVEAACTFFQRVMHGLLSVNKRPEHLVWGGDQIILKKMIGHLVEGPKVPEIIDVDGVRILLLPGGIYNASPASRSRGKLPFYEKAKILHFKGQRKEQMIPYWEKYFK